MAHFPNSFYPHATAPGEVVGETRLDPEVVAVLRARGHEVTVVGWSLGRLSAMSRSMRGQLHRAATNPRYMQGYAVGR